MKLEEIDRCTEKQTRRRTGRHNDKTSRCGKLALGLIETIRDDEWSATTQPAWPCLLSYLVSPPVDRWHGLYDCDTAGNCSTS